MISLGGMFVVGIQVVSSGKTNGLEAPFSKHVLKSNPAMFKSLLREFLRFIYTALVGE